MLILTSLIPLSFFKAKECSKDFWTPRKLKLHEMHNVREQSKRLKSVRCTVFNVFVKFSSLRVLHRIGVTTHFCPLWDAQVFI